jgi:hypothetical protein
MVREVDSRRIVEKLRSRARSADERWSPVLDEPPQLQPIRDHPALRYMHEHWATKSSLEPPPVRQGLGRPKETAKAVFRRWLFSAMSRYLDEQQELTANMVRLQDALAKRCDTLYEEQTEALEALRADMVDLAAHVETLIERRRRDEEAGPV